MLSLKSHKSHKFELMRPFKDHSLKLIFENFFCIRVLSRKVCDGNLAFSHFRKKPQAPWNYHGTIISIVPSSLKRTQNKLSSISVFKKSRIKMGYCQKKGWLGTLSQKKQQLWVILKMTMLTKTSKSFNIEGSILNFENGSF